MFFHKARAHRESDAPHSTVFRWEARPEEGVRRPDLLNLSNPGETSLGQGRHVHGETLQLARDQSRPAFWSWMIRNIEQCADVPSADDQLSILNFSFSTAKWVTSPGAVSWTKKRQQAMFGPPFLGPSPCGVSCATPKQASSVASGAAEIRCRRHIHRENDHHPDAANVGDFS